MSRSSSDIDFASSVAEISWEAFSSNWKTLQSKLPKKTGILAMVKTNAYGHDLGIIWEYCHKLGAAAFGVANILEAVELRALGCQGKIVSFGKLNREALDAAFEFDIRIIVHSLDDVDLLTKYKRPLTFHLEIETGMNRLGIQPKSMSVVLEWLKQTPHIMEGVFTHFAESEIPDSSYTQHQMELFHQALSIVKGYPKPFIIHHDNTGAIFLQSEHGQWVRPGISLYGYHPDGKVKNHQLKPVLKWLTTIMQINKIKKGDYVSYNRTFCAKKDMTIATIPVGYGDGFSRKYRSVSVGYRKERCPIVGTICMDSMMIDVGSVKNPKIGDPVYLMGSGANQEPDAREYAKVDQTIPYEVLTRISPRVLRTQSK